LADVGRHFGSYLWNQKLVSVDNIKDDFTLMEYGVDDTCSQSFLRVGSGNVFPEITVTGMNELIYYSFFHFSRKVQETSARNS